MCICPAGQQGAAGLPSGFRSPSPWQHRTSRRVFWGHRGRHSEEIRPAEEREVRQEEAVWLTCKVTNHSSLPLNSSVVIGCSCARPLFQRCWFRKILKKSSLTSYKPISYEENHNVTNLFDLKWKRFWKSDQGIKYCVQI